VRSCEFSSPSRDPRSLITSAAPGRLYYLARPSLSPDPTGFRPFASPVEKMCHPADALALAYPAHCPRHRGRYYDGSRWPAPHLIFGRALLPFSLGAALGFAPVLWRGDRTLERVLSCHVCYGGCLYLPPSCCSVALRCGKSCKIWGGQPPYRRRKRAACAATTSYTRRMHRWSTSRIRTTPTAWTDRLERPPRMSRAWPAKVSRLAPKEALTQPPRLAPPQEDRQQAQPPQVALQQAQPLLDEPRRAVLPLEERTLAVPPQVTRPRVAPAPARWTVAIATSSTPAVQRTAASRLCGAAGARSSSRSSGPTSAIASGPQHNPAGF